MCSPWLIVQKPLPSFTELDVDGSLKSWEFFTIKGQIRAQRPKMNGGWGRLKQLKNSQPTGRLIATLASLATFECFHSRLAKKLEDGITGRWALTLASAHGLPWLENGSIDDGLMVGFDGSKSTYFHIWVTALRVFFVLFEYFMNCLMKTRFSMHL